MRDAPGRHHKKALNQLEIERTSPLGSLRHETFRTIWSANLVSSFGALIQGVGAAWLMTSMTSSVDMVALVQSATALPIMLFSLVGGAVADNFNRRRVMLTGAGVSCSPFRWRCR